MLIPEWAPYDKDSVMIKGNSLSYTVQSCLWLSIMMEISGDLCERAQNTRESPWWWPTPPFSPSSPRVTRQSACVSGRAVTMCSFSRECRQSSQPSLHQRREEGERRQETGGKPLRSPSPCRFPPSFPLSVSLPQHSFSHHSPSLFLRIAHSLRHAYITAPNT